MTLTPDANAVAAAEAQLASAQAAYQAAQKKYAVNRTDQVTVSCFNLDNVKQTYDDAVNAYNALATNWRVQVNGSLDISPQKAQLDRAKAAYDKAVIECNLAKASVNDSSVKSALAQVEQAKANLESLKNPAERTTEKARIQLEQARLSLEQARRSLDDVKIVAPHDGVVTAVNAVVGAPGSSAAMVMLADTSKYHIDVLIDETEVGQVQVGQKAEVTFDALPKAKATGIGQPHRSGRDDQSGCGVLQDADRSRSDDGATADRYDGECAHHYRHACGCVGRAGRRSAIGSAGRLLRECLGCRRRRRSAWT